MLFTTTFLLIVVTSTSTSTATDLGPCTTQHCQEDQQCCEKAGCCYECCGLECCPLPPQKYHFKYTAVVVVSTLILIIGVGTIGTFCVRYLCRKCGWCDGTRATRRSQQVPVSALPTYVFGRGTGPEPSPQVSLLDQSGGNFRPSAPVLPPPSYEDAVEDAPLDPGSRMKAGGGGTGPGHEH